MSPLTQGLNYRSVCDDNNAGILLLFKKVSFSLPIFKVTFVGISPKSSQYMYVVPVRLAVTCKPR